MDSSIKESSRAANAMEAVATATTNNANLMQTLLHKQMRAYVVIDSGTATYQDKNNVFAANVLLKNSGYTPARKISYCITAGIIRAPELPDDFIFSSPETNRVSDVTLSPRQEFTIHGYVDRLEDEDAVSILKGDGRRLWVWGTVRYEDIFGDIWHTNFCFHYLFYTGQEGDVRFNSYYYLRHNDAT